MFWSENVVLVCSTVPCGADVSDRNFGCSADLYNHPDYQYLVHHNGEPNLSLFGGPSADITPANLLSKLMTRWSEEAEQSPESASSSATAEACLGTAAAPFSCTDHSNATARASSATAAAARRRSKGGLKPSADAVSMANTGCRAVPGMSPAEYREALYSTWMTGRPWGMQYMPADSDDEVSITQLSCWQEGSTTPGSTTPGSTTPGSTTPTSKLNYKLSTVDQLL